MLHPPLASPLGAQRCSLSLLSLLSGNACALCHIPPGSGSDNVIMNDRA